MKFLEIRLLAFGPFTNLVLDLTSPEQGMHLFFGRNEAGKSTTLRALTGLLYGIKERSDRDDAHLHAAKDLRIGATIESKQGLTLSIVRRKGRINTLLDPEGTPLDESRLLPFLGGVGEDLFRSMFGLDDKTLRDGGQALLAGNGELGASLFGAELGASVYEIAKNLRGEADAIFTPKAKTRPLNEALRAFKEAQATSRDYAVSAEKWREQETEVERLEQELGECQAKRKETKALHHKLLRAKHLLLPIGERERLTAERAALGHVILLPENASKGREDASREATAAAAEIARLGIEIADLTAERDHFRIPHSLVLDGDAVEEAQNRLGAIRKARSDLPRLVLELGYLENDGRELLRRLRKGVALEEVETLRIDPAAEIRIKSLSLQRPAIEGKLEQLQGAILELTAEQAGMRAALLALEASADTTGLRLSLERAQKHGDLEEQLQIKLREAGRQQKRAADQLAALGLFQGNLGEAARLPLPTADVIERFARDWDESARNRRRLDERTQIGRTRLREIAREIETLELTSAVPTEALLDAARARRTEAWRAVREGLSGGGAAPDQIASFEREMTDADEIADRLRREAERVARLSGLLAERNMYASEIAESERESRAEAARLDSLQSEWRNQWKSAGIEPRPPSEMRGWIDRHANLCRAIESLNDLDLGLASLRQQIALHAGELRSALSGANVATSPDEPLSALLHRARGRLEALEAVAQERQSLERQTAEAERKLALLVRRQIDAESARASWSEAWAQALGSVGLSRHASSEEATAALDELRKLFDKVDKARELRRRVKGIERDAAAFASDVLCLIEAHLPELSGAAPEEAAEELIRRYRTGVNDLEKLRMQDEHLTTKRALYDAQSERRRKAEARLADLMQAAQVETEAALAAAEVRSERARQIDAELVRVDRRLSEIAGGDSIASLVEEVAGLDPHGLAAHIEEIDESQQALDEERSSLDAAIARAKHGFSGWSGDSRAVDALADAQEALAKIRGYAERYIRVRLASSVLDREIERYRERNQAPLLLRSGELFARLTLGSFSGLRAGIDDRDQPTLRAVRADGKEVEMLGLSDGTRDQLYLSLRIAALERQTEGNEPMPFVVDDILIHFDDERARAALLLLGELARRTQVLFFTHHARLVELAQEAIPAGRLRLHELADPAPAKPRVHTLSSHGH